MLACDGIWDVMTNEEVVSFVRENIAAGIDPEEICESLMMRCLAPDCQMAGLGCDNMTVVIVCLLQGNTYEDLIEKCKLPAVLDIKSQTESQITMSEESPEEILQNNTEEIDIK